MNGKSLNTMIAWNTTYQHWDAMFLENGTCIPSFLGCRNLRHVIPRAKHILSNRVSTAAKVMGEPLQRSIVNNGEGLEITVNARSAR